MLRKKGHDMRTIAGLLGRSTSFIFKICRVAKMRHDVPAWFDLRKLPTSRKKLQAKIRGQTMDKLLAGWVAFILGEVDRPP